MINYKSMRCINGKPKWVIIDEHYNIINISPTKEILKSTLDERDIIKMCCVCRCTETYDHWFTHKCDKIDCTKYLCRTCYRESGRPKKKDIKRKCNMCGREESCHWYKDGGLDLCNICYQKYNPNSTNNTIKSMAKRRINRTIHIDKFDDLGDNDLGYIVECIVCDTYGIKNYNDETDNYRSPFDAIHPEYGRLQIKGVNLIEGQWHPRFRDTEVLWPMFDSAIIICMDDNKPWKNVERVYKIPQEEFVNRKGIAIVKNPTDCVGDPVTPWYEKYRIDEKPFNGTWHDFKDKGYIIRDVRRRNK